MGCDIHFYVEKREGDRWVSADTWKVDPRWPDEGPSCKEFYSDRNYNLFAILANVRNGYGFAGCETGEGFTWIADPRGLPTDLSPELNAYAKRHMDHTPSHLLLSEVLAFDWTQTATLYGTINGPGRLAWSDYARERGDPPREWCGGVSGPKIEHTTPELLDQRIAQLREQGWQGLKERVAASLENVYARYSWTSSYGRCCKEFWSDTIPKLLRVGRPEDVRLVFWFDS